MTESVAIYIRVSTQDQDTKRQFDELREYANDQYPNAAIEEYADIISGADETGGDEFQQLWDDIESDGYDVVIVHEISRLSRLGRAAIAEFIKHCTENGAGIESLDVGLEIRVDDPELQKTVYTMVASLMGDLAKIEHQQKLDRINSGIKAAKRQGKWTGRPPFGFTTDDDGYLVVDPDKYVRMQSALEMLETETGTSLSAVARHTGVPKSSLSQVSNDADRRKLYLYGEANDERIETAVSDGDISHENELSMLRERIDDLEQQVEHVQRTGDTDN